MTNVLLLNTRNIFNNELIISFQIMKGQEMSSFKDVKSTMKMVCRTSARLISYE